MVKKVKKQNMSILDLFKVMQLTRSQPQYGYVLAGMKKHELSDLAAHHYLVTFIGLQLCKLIQRAGGKVNTLEVLELCMIHDLGELFGGDIGMPYARRNPKAKKLSRMFEEENAKFLSEMFLGGKDEFMKQWNIATEPSNDSSYIAKFADLLETFNFKYYNNDFSKVDVVLAKERFPEIIQSIKDKKAKEVLKKVLVDFNKNFTKTNARGIISGI